MNNRTNPYQVVDFPPERRGMAAYLDLKSGRHCMYALLEVDVTVARKFIEDYKAKTGEQLSFTGYLISCLARAVDEDKAVQAYRKGSKQLVVFDDVDVGFMIELKKGEKRILTGHVIRAANRKTFWEIHQEIRSVQSNQVPSDAEKVSWFRSAMLLPWPLSSVIQGFVPYGHAPRPDDCYFHGRHRWHLFGRDVWQRPRRLGDCYRFPRARPGRGGHSSASWRKWMGGSSRARSSA